MPAAVTGRDHLQVRIEPSLKEQITRLAETNGRTITKEVERALKHYLECKHTHPA